MNEAARTTTPLVAINDETLRFEKFNSIILALFTSNKRIGLASRASTSQSINHPNNQQGPALLSPLSFSFILENGNNNNNNEQPVSPRSPRSILEAASSPVTERAGGLYSKQFPVTTNEQEFSRRCGEVLLHCIQFLSQLGLLTPYQIDVMQWNLRALHPRYIQAYDVFMQRYKANELSLRSAARSQIHIEKSEDMIGLSLLKSPAPNSSSLDLSSTAFKLPSAKSYDPLSANPSLSIFAIKTACEVLNEAMQSALEEQWSTLFQELSTAAAKRLSKTERSTLHLSSTTLTYGEVSFSALYHLFSSPALMSLPHHSTFVDLGSGSGRAVMAAAFLYPFDRLRGIEILDALHTASLTILSRYDSEIRPQREQSILQQQISFVRGDFLALDWSDADCVFANSTCYDETMMTSISKQGKLLRDGAFLITISKRLSNPYFQLVDSRCFQMSWGLATMHIHQKITPMTSQIIQTHM